MKTTYNPNLKAHVSVDDENKVRHIRHSQEYWESEENIPRVSAEVYLNEWAETLQIPHSQLQNLSKKVSFYDPHEQGVEYQLNEEKHMFDSTTVGYYQTYLNTPVWRKGLSVKIKQNPNRVIGSTNNSEDDLKGALPDEKAIDRYKNIFRQIATKNPALDPALGHAEEEGEGEAEAEVAVRKLLNISTSPTKGRRGNSDRSRDRMRLLSGKFFIYKYDPRKRYAGKPLPPEGKSVDEVSAEDQEIPIPKLPPVSDKIRAGRAYLVAEIVFISNLGGFGGISWLILVEIQTGSILYIECMTAGVNGLVFKRDPMVKTGDLTIVAADSNADLNLQRDDEILTNLDGSMAGTQNLRGTFVDIEELTVPHADPDVPVPTQPMGTDFDYDSRSNNFAAVSAYYHQTVLFKTIEGLGFPVAIYLDGTTFPIPVDHRGLGNDINAHCVGNTVGTLHMCYALCDTTNLAEPLGRAVDPWVHWHEMGGHGLLYDHVGSANFGFAHSAGDGLAAIQMDPESGLRLLPERFRYAPFRPFGAFPLPPERRFDRPVGTWAWNGGANDDGQYGSEQILATCHFRIYRSLGGDANDTNRRKFASRVTTYLILQTIESLTSMSNPSNAQDWCEAMQDIDSIDWTTEGFDGGAYNKVIRWAFEKQGSYQPVGAPIPVTTEGAPPNVDVYIDDGRGGEYQYIHAHWQNQSMWNRNAADGQMGHQNAIDGQMNYMYGKVKNRGPLNANNVTVRAYHSLPGAGLVWPNDFVEMNPIGGLPIVSVAGNNAAEITVGPFEWEPNINAYGHDCVLMIASVAEDVSNVDKLMPGQTLEEWRLVPHDNNIGQRNVSVVPGAGGGEALMASLEGAFFMAGNNLHRRGAMELRVEMPKALADKGWMLQFDGIATNKFTLKAGEKRKVRLKLKKGLEFTKADIEGGADRMINVSLLGNGVLLGGMSYYVDPDLKKPSGGQQPGGKDCDGAAQKLLDCLKVSGDKKVKKVCVKKVSVDIELDNDCCCD
jgi:hypothetical protein